MAAKPSAKPAKSKAQVWGTRAARLALIAALAWLGLTTANGLAALILGPQPVEPAEAAENIPDLPAPPFSADPGQWTVAGLPFAVQVLTPGAGELAPLLDRVPVVPPQPGEVAPESREWLPLIRRRLSVITRRDDVTIYGLDQPDLRVRVSTVRRDRREHLAGGCVAYPRGTDVWTLLLLTPQPSGATARLTPADHLLPLPQDAVTHCVRRAAGGPVQCELVAAPQSVGELEPLWRNAGWTVERPAATHADGRSLAYCTRGDEVIQVQAHGDASTGNHLLMLLRVPGAN